jgi:hypothetical protein
MSVSQVISPLKHAASLLGLDILEGSNDQARASREALASSEYVCPSLTL